MRGPTKCSARCWQAMMKNPPLAAPVQEPLLNSREQVEKQAEQDKPQDEAKRFWDSEVVTFCMPMLFAMFGMWFQLAFEHFATYIYVQKYAKFGDPHSPLTNVTRLHDEVQERFFPTFQIPMGAIDKSAYVPALVFAALTAWMLWKFHEKRCDKSIIYAVWTKVCVMWSVLAILKGILDSATVIPDSMGWEECRDVRLKSWGLTFFRGKEDGGDHSGEQPFWKFLVLDFALFFWSDRTRTPPMRLCCDMMLSGHTFTVAIFGFGVYELVRIGTGDQSQFRIFHGAHKLRLFLLTSILVLLVLQQGVEIYAVQTAHFHYTVDIVVAIVMSFLVWTNVMIPHFAKQWALRSSTSAKVNKEEFERFNSVGDTFIPVCMVPFCCGLAGWNLREHLYKDNQVRAFIRKVVGDKHGWNANTDDEDSELHKQARDPLLQIVQKCERRMNMDESISLVDIVDSFLLKETFVMDYLPESPQFRIKVRLYHRKWIESHDDVQYAIQVLDGKQNPRNWNDLEKNLEKEDYPLTVRRKVVAKTELVKSRGIDISAAFQSEVLESREIELRLNHKKPSRNTAKITGIKIPILNRSFRVQTQQDNENADTVRLTLEEKLDWQELHQSKKVEVQVYYDFEAEAVGFKKWWLGYGDRPRLSFNRKQVSDHLVTTYRRWRFRCQLLETFDLKELWNDVDTACKTFCTESKQDWKEMRASVGDSCNPLVRFCTVFLKPMFLQFGIPVVIGFLVYYLSILCFAISTQNYVQSYKDLDLGNAKNGNDDSILEDPFRQAFSKTFDVTLEYPSNVNKNWQAQDPLVISLFIFLFVVTYMERAKRTNALQVLHKVTMVLALMVPLTVALSLVTTIPDPAGFKVCKNRLEQMDDRGSNFYQFFAADNNLWKIIMFVMRNEGSEFRGANCGTSFADSLGFSIVISLANFELSLFLMKYHPIRRVYVVGIGSIIGTILVIRRIWYYEEYNIHYTMEWILQIVLAFMFYTNGAVTIASKTLANESRKVENYFEVPLEKPSGGKGCLGIILDTDGVVRGVTSDKAVSKWNEKMWTEHPRSTDETPQRVVCVGDKLVRVNGKTTVNDMKKELIEVEEGKLLQCQFLCQKQVWMMQSNLTNWAKKGATWFTVKAISSRVANDGVLSAHISEKDKQSGKLNEVKVKVYRGLARYNQETYHILPEGEGASGLPTKFSQDATVKFYSHGEGLREKVEQLVSAGDVLIPPCCFPFCCYWGRFHILHDDKVGKVFDAADLDPNDKKALKALMNFGEGIRMDDVREAFMQEQQEKDLYDV